DGSGPLRRRAGAKAETAPGGAGGRGCGCGPGARQRSRWRLSTHGPAAVRLWLAAAGVLPAARQGRRPGARTDRGAPREGEQGSRGDAAPLAARRAGTATGMAPPAARARPGPRRGACRTARRPGAEVSAGGPGARLAVRLRLQATVSLPADGTPRPASRL